LGLKLISFSSLHIHGHGRVISRQTFPLRKASVWKTKGDRFNLKGHLGARSSGVDCLGDQVLVRERWRSMHARISTNSASHARALFVGRHIDMVSMDLRRLCSLYTVRPAYKLLLRSFLVTTACMHAIVHLRRGALHLYSPYTLCVRVPVVM
jgi:hypothetical protein